MPRLRPFKALRYARAPGQEPGLRLIDDLHAVTDAQRRAWTRADGGHPIHLIESPEPQALLRRWREEGVLLEEREQSFHVVELQSASGRQGPRPPARYLLGVLEPEPGLPTLEESPEEWPPSFPLPVLAADDHLVLRRLLGEIAARVPAELEVRSAGLLVRLWRLTDATQHLRMLQALEDLMIRPLGPLLEEEASLVAVVPLSDPGLEIRPVHRGLRGVDTFEEGKLLTLVQAYARVYELEAPLTTAGGQAEARERLATLAAGYHAVLLVLPGGRGRILRFRQALDLAHIKAAPRNPTLRSLDLALLNALVLRTVLGLHAPEAPGHPQVVPVPTLEQLVAQVDAGLYQAGFALNPPPLWEIRAVMEARQQLPPRTLALDPIPPAGLLYLSPEAS